MNARCGSLRRGLLLAALAALSGPVLALELADVMGLLAQRRSGEVRFTEWTRDGRLRHPAWRGLRADKRPDHVVRET